MKKAQSDFFFHAGLEFCFFAPSTLKVHDVCSICSKQGGGACFYLKHHQIHVLKRFTSKTRPVSLNFFVLGSKNFLAPPTH